MKTTIPELERQLEPMIDASDLAAVIEALANVAGVKAEHIASAWQDATTAKVWDRAARCLSRAADQIAELGI